MQGPHFPLRMHGTHPRVNVADDFRQVEEHVGSLSPSLKDLIDIASAVYVADMFHPPDASFYREMELQVQVRNLQLWEELADLLGEALSFLTQSPFHVGFVAGKEESHNQMRPKAKSQADSVVCFSGGLDSYAGAASLLQRQTAVLLVSQSNSSQLSSVQRKVGSYLLAASESSSHILATVGQSRGSGRGALGSQKYAVQPTRSFLFLALAGAAAMTIEARHLFMFENGPIALGIPYTQARFNTRTVHPLFLDYMQQILSKMPDGDSLLLENPFGAMTKAEITSTILGSRFQNGVKLTSSCSRRWRVHLDKKRLGKNGFKGWHCGMCLPCIHRRISVLRAGLESEDDAYLVDVLSEYPFRGMTDTIAAEALLNVRDLLSYAGQFNRLPDAELFERYPDLFFESDRLSPGEAVRVYRRMAQQTLEELHAHGNTQLREDAERVS